MLCTDLIAHGVKRKPDIYAWIALDHYPSRYLRIEKILIAKKNLKDGNIQMSFFAAFPLHISIHLSAYTVLNHILDF